ncbi:hypothetical protein TrispH2_009373 [Trichoplax sp. H2]|nr:hypothetical protein TrispH2_009373 [Trichoplax sp. H2]|eukprot:RDD38211.1 hypothetical protein TrispH2_009373 [Trichoplax sp. H2]
MGKSAKKFRKVKSIDPFYRGPRKADSKGDTYDLPPSAAKANDKRQGAHPKRKFKNNPESNENRKRKPRPRKSPTTKVSNKSKPKPHFASKQPHESMKKFYDRIDREANEIVTEQMKDLKEIRAKRREYLKVRREKLKEKNRKKKDDKHDEFKELKDEIKFGEVVQQPPRITAKPRKSVEKAVASNLLLDKLLSKDKKVDYDNKEENDRGADWKKKKFRDMTTTEKQSILAERSKAILAYRQLVAKKRFESKK